MKTMSLFMVFCVKDINRADACMNTVHEITRNAMPWLLDMPGNSYSNALIFPLRKLSAKQQARLKDLGAFITEGQEIEFKFSLKDAKPMPDFSPYKEAGHYLCIRSFQRVTNSEYRIEAYSAREFNN